MLVFLKYFAHWNDKFTYKVNKIYNYWPRVIRHFQKFKTIKYLFTSKVKKKLMTNGFFGFLLIRIRLKYTISLRKYKKTRHVSRGIYVLLH
jgi:hypothetical protein